MNFRNAISADANMLLDLTESTFRESWLNEGNIFDLNAYVAENFTVSVLNQELSNPNITYLLAEEKNQTMGYCKLERNLNPDGFKLKNPISIGRLYVRKQFQKQSIGSKLLDESLLIGARENFNNIWLGVWNKNPEAIRLYERFGFRKIGGYQFKMGNEISDDFIMHRPI
ncbi:GNAT family N-acetyltransferase [soil metagenome]